MSDEERRRRLGETEALRRDLLHRIGARRDSVVVAYLTGTRPGALDRIFDSDVEVIEKHVHAARDMGARNLDLFLMTNGGDAATPWNLVAMIREYFKGGGFRVILPGATYSAGARVALGSDEVVMGPGSVLGAVDTHWGGVTASQYQNLLDMLRPFGFRAGAARRKAVDWLASQSDPLAFADLYRHWYEDRRVLLKMLSCRRRPLSGALNEKLADFMLYRVAAHNQAIRRSAARAAGMSFITDIEATGIEAETRQLFAAYVELLKLGSPYARRAEKPPARRGDEQDFDVDGVHMSIVPMAVVESVHDTNAAYAAYGHRHWDHAPPVPQTPGLSPKVAGVGAPGDPALDVHWVATGHAGLPPVAAAGLAAPRRR